MHSHAKCSPIAVCIVLHPFLCNAIELLLDFCLLVCEVSVCSVCATHLVYRLVKGVSYRVFPLCLCISLYILLKCRQLSICTDRFLYVLRLQWICFFIAFPFLSGFWIYHRSATQYRVGGFFI